MAKKDDLHEDGSDEPHDYDGNDSDMEVLEGEFTDDEDDGVRNPLPPNAYETPPGDEDENQKTRGSNNSNSPIKKKKKYTKNLVKKTEEKQGNAKNQGENQENVKNQEEEGVKQTRPRRKTKQPKYFDNFVLKK